MMAADAWDECVACGHDRDDHQDGRYGCSAHTDETFLGLCNCTAFVEAS